MSKDIPDFKWEVRHTLIVRRYKCEPDEITRLLELTPNDVTRKGDPITPTSKRLAKVDFWSHVWFEGNGDTQWSNGDEHKVALSTLLDYLDHRREVVSGLAQSAEVYVTTGVFSDSFNAAYRLVPSDARKLADLGIEWVLDVYAG